MRRSVLCSLAALTSLVVAAPTSQAATPLRYVAWATPTAPPRASLPPDPHRGCPALRSLVNYPHDIAAATGAQLTDVTCGAAQTKDYFTSQ